MTLLCTAVLLSSCCCVDKTDSNFADAVMQHSYGFIRCLEREARLFFHYSEFGGDADTMRTGGDYRTVAIAVLVIL